MLIATTILAVFTFLAFLEQLGFARIVQPVFLTLAWLIAWTEINEWLVLALLIALFAGCDVYH